MLVIFLCQLDRAMECPEICPNSILYMSRRVFMDEVNILMIRLVIAHALLNMSGPHSIS